MKDNGDVVVFPVARHIELKRLSRNERERALPQRAQRRKRRYFYKGLSFVTFVSLVVKKVFPLKTVEPL